MKTKFYFEDKPFVPSKRDWDKAIKWCRSVGLGSLSLSDGMQRYLTYCESLIP